MVQSKQVRCDRHRSMDADEIAPLVAEFVAHLRALGYSRLTASDYEASARHLACWLSESGLPAADIDDDVFDRFGRHRCQCLGGTRRLNRMSGRYVKRARRFFDFLADRETVPQRTHASLPTEHPQVLEFKDWLRQHRGVSERTINHNVHVLMRLLPALGSSPAQYDAQRVRQVLLDQTTQVSSSYIRSMTTALRNYLRFLGACGLCRPGLEHAVPTIPQWRLAVLPRYISTADVERLITTCDLTKPDGIRDRAILLLLARLGLRAGDIAELQLHDVDWHQATLAVCGKGRREARLPLPQDVGDAVLDYLHRGRPGSDCHLLFLRSVAPFHGLRRPTVSSVVCRALDRAGIAAPSKGTNLLRHSAATAMLRGGATLDMVGTVLRHRSPDMTAHYAKVDFLMLQQIAQPWPGETQC